MCFSGCKTETQKKPSERSGASTPKDSTTAKCAFAALTVFVKQESDGTPIENATIEIKGVGSKLTQKDGKVIFEKIKPGKYKVEARKDVHIPDPVETEVELAEKSKKEVTLKLTLLELHIYVDANRDGKVDDDWKENNKWEAGKGKTGAVILCNNDDEDSDKKVDNENQKVDTANDLPDLAPLVLRKKLKGKSFPAGWKAKLEVSDEKKIRIFDKRADGGKEVIGPDKGKTYKITDLKPDEHELGMEATIYPIKGFDGIIGLKLSLLDDKGKVLHSEEAKVRTAPWIMFNHAYQTEKVYVVSTADNNTFRTKLRGELPVGILLQEAPQATYGNDRWMQDAMEPGFASMTNSSAKDKWNVPTTLRTANDRPAMRWGPIDRYPKEVLLAPGYGFVEAMPPSSAGNSLDSFGNLECSPPFTHKVSKREYKFGRIVYGGGGREMQKKVRDFLTAQKV